MSPETIQHPGKPDALISFDYEDFEQRGDTSYWREAFGRGDATLAFNVRPEHLVPGVYGQAMAFRTGGLVESILPDTDSVAESKIEHPLGFNGILTALLLPAGDEWGFGPGSQTVNFWLKFKESKSGYSLLLEPIDKGGFHMGFHPGPTLMMAGAFGGLNAPFPNVVDQWQMVSLVRDVERGLLSYYVNGEIAGRAEMKGSNNEARGPTVFSGRWKKGARYPGIVTAGDFDELAMYERALTAGQIMAIYQSGLEGQQSLTGDARTEQGLAAFIDLDASVGSAPLTVNFSTHRTINTTGSEAQFTWDFGDGNTGSGPQPQHIFQNDGEYIVSLTVTVGDQVSTATYPIQVANRAPVAIIETLSQQGASAVFSAGKSYDPDGKPVTVQWRALGKTTTGPELNLSSIPAGSHIIHVTVTDAQGASSSRQTLVSVPDSEGYRLPDNPGETVPGLHFAHYQMFKEGIPAGIIDPSDFSFQKIIRLMKTGTINQWSNNSIDPVQSGRYFVHSGYIDIPEDDTYTLNVYGVKNTRVEIGTDFHVHSSASFDRPNMSAEPVKLRRGLHLIRILQPAYLISKNASTNYFFGQAFFEHSDGRTFTLNSRPVHRSIFNPEQPAVDQDRMGVPLAAPAMLAAGNTAPSVRLQTTVLAEMPGAKRVQVTAIISDADADPTEVTWHTPDGAVITGQDMVSRLLTAGEHAFVATVRDNRGGLTRERTVVSVPVWRDQRSISIDFVSISGRGVLGAIFPGERAGVVDSAAWNGISNMRDGTAAVSFAPRAAANTKPSKDALGFWFDSTGKQVDLRITVPDGVRGQKTSDIASMNKHNPQYASDVIWHIDTQDGYRGYPVCPLRCDCVRHW